MKNLPKQKKKVAKSLNNIIAFSKKSYKDTKKLKGKFMNTKDKNKIMKDYKLMQDFYDSINFTDGKKEIDLDTIEIDWDAPEEDPDE